LPFLERVYNAVALEQAVPLIAQTYNICHTIFMARSLVKKWLLYTITAYLMFATMGTFTLTAFDASIVDNFAGKSPVHGVFLTSFDRFMCTPAIIETKVNHFSPLRHCLLRTIMPLSLLAAGSDLLCSAVRPVAKTAVKAGKDSILLKLRI
jgi:hypothetical protein